jgi:hypothetical protein
MPKPVEQVGGNHYTKAGSKCPHCGGHIEHWDYAAGLPYLDAQISKYVDRHQDKGGFQDLLKALTYWEKAVRNYYPQEYALWLQARGLQGVGQVAQQVTLKAQAPAWTPPGEVAFFRDIDQAVEPKPVTIENIELTGSPWLQPDDAVEKIEYCTSEKASLNVSEAGDIEAFEKRPVTYWPVEHPVDPSNGESL